MHKMRLLLVTLALCSLAVLMTVGMGGVVLLWLLVGVAAGLILWAAGVEAAL